MKKKKLITRIIAMILVIVTVLGFVIPYVAAAEIETDPTADEILVGSAMEDPNAPPLPPYSLPIEFEYVLESDVWRVAKAEGNTNPAIMLDGRHESFDATSVTIFVGNLETYEIKVYQLHHAYNYVTSMDLNDGYYVVFSDYIWSDSNGGGYMISGGNYNFIYVGDNYNPDMYNVEFQTTDGIFSLSLANARGDAQKIPHTSSLLVSPSEVEFPEDAKLEKRVIADAAEPVTPPDETEPETPADGEDKKSGGLFKSIFGTILSRILASPLLCICIIVCCVGLLNLHKKKIKEMEERLEADRYDDRRID